MLKRKAGRPKLRRVDRMLLAAFARLIPNGRFVDASHWQGVALQHPLRAMGRRDPFDGTFAPLAEDDVQRVGSPSPGDTLILRPSRSRASSDATHRSPDSPTTNFVASQTRSRRPTSPKA